jgi:hypothetical protein
MDDTVFCQSNAEDELCLVDIQVLRFLHATPCSIAVAGIVVELHCLIENDFLHIFRPNPASVGRRKV